MKKLSLVLSIALLLACASLCFGKSSDELSLDVQRSDNYKHALSFRKDIENGRLREKTNRTIEALVKTSITELKKKGATTLALRIDSEYETTYRDFLSDRGVGDHEGVKWLLSIHEKIEFVLGETICRALRLHDLWVLAHTIPVVFKCIDNVDSDEYKLHFVPFCGVVSYWVGYFGCVAGSFGTGFVFACGFVGMGVELLVRHFVAPPLSTPCWKKSCKNY